MIWQKIDRADPVAARLADRHYSRKTPGADQFTPPGRVLCLRTGTRDAVWASSWPFAEYVMHDWAGAWMNSLFRNEAPHRYLSSDLIVQAVAATRWKWPSIPDLGMVTLIDPAKVRHKRDPGRCYLKAGFKRVGTTKGGLIVLQLLPGDMPPPDVPLNAEPDLLEALA